MNKIATGFCLILPRLKYTFLSSWVLKHSFKDHLIPPENTISPFCAPPLTPVRCRHPSRLRAGLSLQLPPFGGTSLVRCVPLGRQAVPCAFHCMKLWYSAAHCRCLWLSLTHAPGSQLLPCPPLRLDSLVKSPRSSHAVKYPSSLLSGPRSCCGGSLCFGSLCAHGPGSGLTGGEMALSSSFSSDPLLNSLWSTEVEILCQFKCQNAIPI